MMRIFTALMVATLLSGAMPAFAVSLNTDNSAQRAQFYMTKIDTDKDGKISKTEHTAFADKMFSNADTNSDGSISLDELTTAKRNEAADESANIGINARLNNAKKDFNSLKSNLLGTQTTQ